MIKKTLDRSQNLESMQHTKLNLRYSRAIVSIMSMLFVLILIVVCGVYFHLNNQTLSGKD